MTRLALLFLVSWPIFAQPFVYYRGAVNAASFLPPGLPNGAIARGSMFSIFGRNLGPASPRQVSEFPLQTTFAGVSVELTQGTTKVNAIPAYVSAAQLNVIMPSNAPLGAVSLRVFYNNEPSNPIPVNVTATSVGLFSVSGGFGPGIVQNFVSDASRPLNSLAATARPGQVEILWGTGLGAAPFPDAVAPTPMTIEMATEVFVGGKKATVVYAGRSPCCSSIDQIVFEVPSDAPSGCYVPVVVRTRGSVVSNTVTMAIHPTGAPCSDAHNPLSSQSRNGGKTAVARLARDTVRVDTGTSQPYDVVLDSLVATFRQNAASDYSFSAGTALPPLGTCSVYAGSTDRIRSLTSPFAPPGSQVNPGSPLRVEAGSASATVAATAGAEGTFTALLGGQNPVEPITPGPLLNTGPFTLSGPGNAAASAFRATIDGASALTWTNRDQITTLDRTKDLTLTWAAAPGPSRGIAIVGISERIPENAQAGFICLAPQGATSFPVPTYVLAALPASAVSDYAASTTLAIGNIPLTSSSSIAGFDNTLTGMSNWSSKTAVTK